MGEDQTANVGAALLAELRRELGEPALEFLQSLEALTGGFDTRVYGFSLSRAPAGFDRRLVLRVYRPGEGFRARSEGAIQEAVRGTGFPVPRVVLTHQASEPLFGPFLVMERAPGLTMLKQAGRRPWRMPALLRLLAETHSHLHSLDPGQAVGQLAEADLPPVVFDFERWSGELSGRIERGRFHGLRHGLDWLRERFRSQPGAASVLCHGDYHPINILCERDRVTGVVDWSNFFVGEPEADVAITLVILKYGPIDLPGPLLPPADLARRAAAGRYLAEYRRLRPLASPRLRLYEAMRILHALVGAAESRTGGGRPAGYAWAIPRTATALAERFRRLSGRRLFLPPRDIATSSPA